MSAHGGRAKDAFHLVLPSLPAMAFRAPRSWCERSYHKLIYWHEAAKGGHFAAWDQPEIFAAEIRAGFGQLR